MSLLRVKEFRTTLICIYNSQSLLISCFTSSSLPHHFFFTSPSLPSHFSLTSVLFFTASASGLNCIPLLSGLNCIYSLQSLLLPFPLSSYFLIASSPPFHFLLAASSLPPRFLVTASSLISFSLPPLSFFTSLSLLYHSLPPRHNCWQPVQCTPATYTFTFHSFCIRTFGVAWHVPMLLLVLSGCCSMYISSNLSRTPHHGAWLALHRCLQ